MPKNNQITHFVLKINVSIFALFLTACGGGGGGSTDTSVDIGVLSVDAGTSYSFGNASVGTTVSSKVTINNTGDGAISNLSGNALNTPFSYTGGSYPGTDGTCGTDLATSTSCDIDLSFSPSSTGDTDETLMLSYYNETETLDVSVTLSGRGVVGSLTFDNGSSYDFGTVVTGNSSSNVLALSNSGMGTITNLADDGTLSAPFSYTGGAYPGTTGTCGTSVSAMSSCNLDITYTPTLDGDSSQELTFTYDEGPDSYSVSITLEGEGVGIAELAFEEGASYDFGSVSIGNSANYTFTLENTGTETATSLADGGSLSSPFTYTGGTYPGTSGTCGTSLVSLAVCTVDITYTPTMAGSSDSGTLDFSYHDGQASQSVGISLDGSGAAVGDASLSISNGPTYDFGSVNIGSSATVTLTVSNTGGATATSMEDGGRISRPFTYTGGSYPGTSGTCGTSLASSADCTIDLTFTPTGTNSSVDGVNISYHDGSASQKSGRSLTGSGVLVDDCLGDDTDISDDVPDWIKDNFTCATIYTTTISDDEYIVFETDNVPNHASPYWGTDSVNWEAMPDGGTQKISNFVEGDYTLYVPADPTKRSSPASMFVGGVALARNGVLMYKGTSSSGDGLADEIITFDGIKGHPTGTQIYHYHGEATFLTDYKQKMLGVMADGFPIYGEYEEDGCVPDLSGGTCNMVTYPALEADSYGHEHATTDFPDGIFHYHMYAWDSTDATADGGGSMVGEPIMPLSFGGRATNSGDTAFRQ